MHIYLSRLNREHLDILLLQKLVYALHLALLSFVQSWLRYITVIIVKVRFYITHIRQSCFNGTGSIICLAQWQWRNPVRNGETVGAYGDKIKRLWCTFSWDVLCVKSNWKRPMGVMMSVSYWLNFASAWSGNISYITHIAAIKLVYNCKWFHWQYSCGDNRCF